METLRQEVQRFLKQHGITLKKNLGQHFLVENKILDAIIHTAHIQPDDHVIEIGPGIGILTRELLKKTNRVTAIELDAALIPLLQEYTKDRTREGARLDIVQGNALSVPFPQTSYKIVANIPYHITSPLLKHTFVESHPPTSVTLLIQREVAEKIIDTTNASRLTILVGLFGTPKIIKKVPPSAFLPPPKVDSAILHITTLEEPKTDPKTIERVFELTHDAFGQKRKMLRNTIDTTLLEKTHIDPTRRPQTLSIDEWIALAQKSS